MPSCEGVSLMMMVLPEYFNILSAVVSPMAKQTIFLFSWLSVKKLSTALGLKNIMASISSLTMKGVDTVS
jgi:hypothetical protein